MPSPTVVHIKYSSGRHALIVNGMQGKIVSYKEIAACGDFRAATEYYDGTLPRVFTIKAIDRYSHASVEDATQAKPAKRQLHPGLGPLGLKTGGE